MIDDKDTERRVKVKNQVHPGYKYVLDMVKYKGEYKGKIIKNGKLTWGNLSKGESGSHIIN